MKKNLLFFLITLFILFTFAIIFFISNDEGVKQLVSGDYCKEDGECKQGTVMEDGIINKEYCINHKGKWNEKVKMCDLF